MELILLSAFSGIAVFFIIITLFSGEDRDKNTERRLEKIKNRAFTQSEQTQEKVKRNLQHLIQDTEYKIRIMGDILSKFKITEQIKKQLKMADVDMTVDIFLIMSFGLSLPFALAGLLMLDKAIFFIPLALLAFIMPFIILKIRIKNRLTTFTQQFPDALGLISSSLRAGHSLPSSFQIVVNEMPDPISKIFRIVVDDISLGRDTRDALDTMTQIMPGSLDLRFFITAVLIQREIGGNLAEILDNLGYTIRERFKLIGQLNAQTSQAKMSGTILAVAPVAIGAVLWFMNPEYMEPLFTTAMGKLALGGAILSAIIGFLVIMKITDIKI